MIEPRRRLLALLGAAAFGGALVASSSAGAGTRQQCVRPIPLAFTPPALAPVQADFVPHPEH